MGKLSVSILIVLILIVFQSCKKNTSEEKDTRDVASAIFKVKLRSTPKENFSEASVKSMLKQHNFFCRKDDWSKEYCNPNGNGLNNKFERKNHGQVVYDHASDLTWQKRGSYESLNYKNAKAYITKLNHDKDSGYNDWRLPTLEEAMSLMEPTRMNGHLYIDPKFNHNQIWIWTSDSYNAYGAWAIDFYGGYCHYNLYSHAIFVRAVR